MSWQIAALLLFGGLMGLMGLGLPVAFTFMAVNILGGALFMGGEAGIIQLARSSVEALNNFALTPIPFFILMGEILFHTRLALRAIDAIGLLINKVPGRLAIVAIVAGTVFSAISGSTIATTAMLGSLLLPEMLKRGYRPETAMGPIMAIGGVDMLIPPSALAVLLGSLSGISVSDLLVAGIVPGLIMSVCFVGFIILSCTLNPSYAPSEEIEVEKGWARWRPLVVHVAPLVLIFALVVGSMVRGWATPTESAAVGATATILVAVLYRSMSIKVLIDALRGTANVSGSVLFILVGATAFSQVLSFSGASDGLVESVLRDNWSTIAIILAMMALLLFLGCFIDQVSMMMLTLPFFMPIVAKLNIDPIWFGVMFLICMQMGLLTPPFGLLLFTMRGVAPPSITMGQIFRAVIPYVIMGLLVLALVIVYPPVATWLPEALSNK
jgi:tripartite ATP-independent transporter DctM subunit